ncbi:MAG TPA: lysophospholipid acyltransferase family protein, partial [Balneolales bacterium]|nr:lysophospholipid acyltransferase family protein [Balneolales bacterium]
AVIQAFAYLKQDCPVMFFPEGTRTTDGRVHRFSDGAFLLAIKSGAPVLPMAIEGSRECLPKNSWRFGQLNNIRIKVMEPVETKGMSKKDIPMLRDRIREQIMEQIAEWRGTEPGEVDGFQKD